MKMKLHALQADDANQTASLHMTGNAMYFRIFAHKECVDVPVTI